MYFFPLQKNITWEGGGTFDGVFSHWEIIFFPLLRFSFFFLSETGDRKLPAGRSLQLSPQKGRAALVAPPELYPGLRAPGHQARPPPPQRKQEKGRAGRTQPTGTTGMAPPPPCAFLGWRPPRLAPGGGGGAGREGRRLRAAPRKWGRASPRPGARLPSY